MPKRGRPFWITLAVISAWSWSGAAIGQVPGLTNPAAPPAGAAAEPKPQPAPTKESPNATVATASGTIAVDEAVPDERLEETLQDLLQKYPGVTWTEVDVQGGVVTLEGQVDSNGVHDNVTEFVRRVEGVRLVLNRMKTDAEVLTATQLAGRVLEGYRIYFARYWLLMLVSFAVVVGSLMLARVFGEHSETLLSPFLRNPLLRSVVGSVLSSVVVVGGLVMSLSVLDLTRAVLSIVGVAGVAGLAIGFAFKDITENFIASLLLGLRRPFRLGDFITVAGQSGVVHSLNTRATVLVTLEGKQVRIPNAIIFKEILVNSSASERTRGSFEVLVPFEASADVALEAMVSSLKAQAGVLDDPPPRALVAAIEPGGVRLRAFFWRPTELDGDRVASDALLKVKVALQRAGIGPPPALTAVTVAGRVPVDLTRVGSDHPPGQDTRPRSLVTAEQADANLRRDARAARQATPDVEAASAVEHAREIASTQVAGEGNQLLKPESAPAQNGRDG